MIRLIFRGYLVFLKKLLTILIYLAAAVALSAAVVLPFWLLATRQPAIFSLLAVLLFLLLIGLLVYLRVRSGSRGREEKDSKRKSAARTAVRIALFIFLFAGLYGLTLLFMRKLYFFAVPGALLYLFVLGFGFNAGSLSKKPQ